MQFFLVPLGSHGDVHPFVAMGRELRGRGHGVTVFTFHHFQAMVERAGLPFVALGKAGEFEEAIDNPDLWHPRRALGVILRGLILRGMRETYQTLQVHREKAAAAPVVVAPASAFGARILAERHRLPLATVNLQPLTLPSQHQMPVLPNLTWLPRRTRWLNRTILWAADRLVGDPILARETNAFRGELGLPPVRRLVTQWCLSPDLILGLWPDWFGPPLPDWPAQVRLTGFPLYDEAESHPLAAELEAFLAAGPPPLVFTLGSAQKHGDWFFQTSLKASEQLGQRALLLARFAEQIPAHLPPTVKHVTYAPFSRLLPRSGGLIHHGGIGTTAQALAAGLPQLVVPLAHDQFDNADRVHRLGVGHWLPPRSYTVRRASAMLARLLADETIRQTAATVRGRFAGTQPLTATCDALERLGEQALGQHAAAGGAEQERS